MKNRKSQAGFTLVELAVVIVIIGLIIGAVIKGQELIDNARVNSVIAQVNGFRSAITGFQDKYGALPGDLSTATTRIPGCTGANCTNGNGNGVIGTGTSATAAISTEGRMAWQHLAYSNAITGVVPGAAVAGDVYNTNFPGARTGGGYAIINATVGTPALTTMWLRLQGTSGASAPGTTADTGALTPGQAALIDRRMDDGNALTGTVRFGGATTCAPANGVYDETVSTKDCNLYFQVQ